MSQGTASVWDIARIVRRGGHMLSESTWEYWPQIGDNEIPERNISLHQAMAFSAAGYFPYAEAHSGDSTNERTDLFLIHPGRRIAVVTEYKRLYSPEQCGAMVADLERVQRFQPRDKEIEAYQRFGLLAATTWDDRIARWWSSKDQTRPTENEQWINMRGHSGLLTAHWGSVVLLGYEEKRDPDSRFHYLLYSIFEMKPAL